MAACAITDEYQRKGLDVLHLENEALRVEILVGKGGDVTEIRDKRTDTNVLFETPHEWHPPGEGIGHSDSVFTFMDSYPGGWQNVLPAAGGPTTVDGAPFALHGESSLVPWEYRILDDTNERVAVRLSATLSRYPYDLERDISLASGESTLRVTDTVQNSGEVGTYYSWLQHIALGSPLIGPSASLSVPCETVHVDPGMTNDTARLPPGETFDWPVYRFNDGEVDLRKFPPKKARVHDLVALTGLDDGRYTVTNPDLDLGVTVSFPASMYEYLWYWQPFGGFTDAPYFGRNYNVGLEPCTSIPNAGLSEAIENGTANHLDAGEQVTATVEFTTHEPNSEYEADD